MKKITILMIAILFSVCAIAQHVSSTVKNKAMISTKGKIAPATSTKAIIFQDDFSVPANWTIAHAAGTTGDWVIGTGVPSGSYAIPGIQSTSAANGFALFDSDLGCSGNQTPNLTTAASFSCTGHANVQLKFQEMYRRFYDSTFVYVSNNGTTWTKFPVNAGYANNTMSANPTTVGVNISSVAGNQATVWVRFTFYSPSSLGSSAGCGYAWMIDDVVVQDLAQYDLATGNTSLDFDGASYYEAIPMSQMDGVYTYSCPVTNNGYGALTNATLHVNINNSAITGASTPLASLAAMATDTLLALPTITTPTAATAYAAKLSLTQTETDADLTNNNADSITFYATKSEFLRTGSLNNTLCTYSYGPTSAVTGMELGANYYFPNQSEIDTVEVLVYSAHGTPSIFANLYSVDGTGARNLEVSSLNYPITPNLLPALIKLPLTSLFSVAAGSFMTVSISMSVNIAAHDTVFIGTNDAYIGDYQTASAGYLSQDNGSTWNWYYLDNVPIVGLIVTPNAGIQESELNNSINVYPNPVKDLLNIESAYTIINANVVNPLGQVVISETPNTKAFTVNTSGLKSGVYFVQIQTTKGMLNKKITVVK